MLKRETDVYPWLSGEGIIYKRGLVMYSVLSRSKNRQSSDVCPVMNTGALFDDMSWLDNNSDLIDSNL